jgi:hypothetical protein
MDVPGLGGVFQRSGDGCAGFRWRVSEEWRWMCRV